MGYIIALLAESIGVCCTAISAVSIICYFIGSCWLLRALVEDITNDLSFLTADETSPAERYKKMMKRFYNSIRDFSKAEQLSKNEIEKCECKWTHFDELSYVLISFQICQWIQSCLWVHYHWLLRVDTRHNLQFFTISTAIISWATENIQDVLLLSIELPFTFWQIFLLFFYFSMPTMMTCDRNRRHFHTVGR